MANKHPNTSGLKPFLKKENSENTEIQRQGGIASGESKREAKRQKELFNMLLEEKNSNGKSRRLGLLESLLFKALQKETTIKEVLDVLKYDAQLNGEFNENQVVINNNQKELTKEELKELYKKMKE